MSGIMNFALFVTKISFAVMVVDVQIMFYSKPSRAPDRSVILWLFRQELVNCTQAAIKSIVSRNCCIAYC